MGRHAVDTDREIAIANPIALPFVSKLIRAAVQQIEPPEGDKGGSGTETGIQPRYGVPFGVTLNPFLSPFGLPCKQPARGCISAVDLKPTTSWKNASAPCASSRCRCRSKWACRCWAARDHRR